MEACLILGGGGHGRVVMETLTALGWGGRILGIVEAPGVHPPPNPFDIPLLGDETVVAGFAPDRVRLVNGVGSTGDVTARRAVFQRWSQRGYRFATLVHPGARVMAGVWLEEGVQIMAGATVQVGTVVGVNSIVNTGAVVDHDGQLGAHVHVAPGAVLCGMVRVEEGAHVGPGATVIQGTRIGVNAVVGAGAVVIHPVPDGKRVAGVPARELLDGT
ncbi:MAG: acetyltransferase [Magnetococcales bacterium]|nr:acetyltransferase [Magnetococcales bacterium]